MTGRLPTWLADWLGVDLPAAGDAASWRLDSTWHWPPWATVLLILAVILWTAMLYTREASTAGRRYRALELLVAGAHRRDEHVARGEEFLERERAAPAERMVGARHADVVLVEQALAPDLVAQLRIVDDLLTGSAEPVLARARLENARHGRRRGAFRRLDGAARGEHAEAERQQECTERCASHDDLLRACAPSARALR